MPLKDGKPTLHEMIVTERCEKDPGYADAYMAYLLSDPEPDNWQESVAISDAARVSLS